MIKYKNILLIIFFFFSILNSSYSSEKISFLDMEHVVKSSDAGKKILDKIKKINENNVEILKEKELKLKKIEENIKKKQNILSKEELDKEIIKLRIQVNNLRTEKDDMVKNVNKIKNKELKKLYKQINPIIQSYMDKNNITILLDMKNIIAGKTNSNITNDIIDEINKNIN